MTVKEKKVLDDMAKCMSFALLSFPNKPVIDTKTLKPTTWHAWFRDVLKRSGAAEMEDE